MRVGHVSLFWGCGRGGSVSRRDHIQAYRRPPQLAGGTNFAEITNPNASRSSGEGGWGRGASLREAASPPESSPRHLYRTVAAALSAAVTTPKLIGDRPNSQAEPTSQKSPTRTPAALRERGSGGEALLSEKRPLPQNLLQDIFSGGSAREGAFLQKRPLPRNSTGTLIFRMASNTSVRRPSLSAKGLSGSKTPP